MPIHDKKPLFAWQLSDLIAKLTFTSPVLRIVSGRVEFQMRPDKAKKAVLRVLCDHYPNVWPSVPTIGELSNYGDRQVRRVLRELEFKDRLIVDANSRYFWRWPTIEDMNPDWTPERRQQALNMVAHIRIWESDGAGKRGGSGRDCTPQYVICDRRIYDIYQQQRNVRKGGHLTDRARTSHEPIVEGESGHLSSEPGHISTQTRTNETPNQAQTPAEMSAEPTILTNYKNPPPPTVVPENLENLWRGMADLFRSEGKGLLSKAGWAQISSITVDQQIQDTLSSPIEEIIFITFERWIKTRNLDGLKCPLIQFAKEFELELTSFITEREQAKVKREAQRAANLRRIADAETKHAAWKQRFVELTDQALLESRGSMWERGSDIWIEEVKDWLKVNPQPNRYLELNGGLQNIADSTAADKIAQASRDYADQFPVPF